MKTAFLNPPGPKYLYRGSICTYISKARYVWRPKDFLLLSGVFSPETEISFLDAAISETDEGATLRWLADQNSDAVIVALSSIVWEKDFAFLKTLRLQFPKLKILCFGEIFLGTEFKEAVSSYCDGMILDPIRTNVLKLLDGKNCTYTHRGLREAKDNRQVRIHRPRHELFQHPRYRWPFIRKKKYATIYSQFGCPFTCTYCSEAVTNVSYRPWEDLIEEVEALYQEGYQEFHFGDASFGYPKQNAERFLKEIAERKWNIGWTAYIHPQQADEKFLDLAWRSGCHTLVFGIDSSNQQILEKYNRHVRKSDIERFVSQCKDRQIQVCGDVILGFPGEDLKSCEQTIRYAQSLSLDYMSINFATPLMGSAIREDYLNRGILKPGVAGLHTTKASSPQLDPVVLKKLRRKAIFEFYFRPLYLINQLKTPFSLETWSIRANEALGLLRAT